MNDEGGHDERVGARTDEPDRTGSARRSPGSAGESDVPSTAPVSGGGMSGTGAPTRSRSHSGTSTTPGAGPNPGGSPSSAGRRRA